MAAARQTLKVLRFVAASWLGLTAIYGLLVFGDLLGFLLLGVLAWVTWPKRAKNSARTSRTEVQ